MFNSRLVVTLVLIVALVTLALQNMSPALALVFLGGRTVALPLAVWLLAAIALGSITALLLVGLGSSGPAGKTPPRRRWRVQPEPKSPGATPSPRSPGDTPPPPRDTPRSPRGTVATPPPESQRGEDWADWEQRIPVGERRDWDSPPVMARGAGPPPLSGDQWRDRQEAEASMADIATDWDPDAETSAYPARDVSPVEDALEDIASGWEEWEPPRSPPPATAYTYRPDPQAEGRQDQIYAPPDPPQQPWPEEAAQDEDGNPGVYDADYRVIIPPPAHDPDPHPS